MRAIGSLFALTLAACPLILHGQGVDNLAQSLLSTESYAADATFEVLLPSAQDPVTYAISLQSSVAEGDTLSAADYVIRWASDAPSGHLEGFSAYFDGNHYRYRNARLQEYHFADNPDVFMPRGAGSQWKYGVQNQVQFADLLPQNIGMRLKEMAADSNYVFTFHPDTLISKKRCMAIEGVKRNAGYDVQNFKYVFDRSTRLPMLIDLETSPGTISEQLITVTYADGTQQPIRYSEEALIEEWPEVFEKYRESTFRTENLNGRPLPEFSCQRAGGGERYFHNRNEGFSRPVVIVALNPEISTTQATIAAVREATTLYPEDIEVIYAFNTNRGDAISAAVGEPQPEEAVLMSAGSLMRNCGISLFPTLLFVNERGIVKDVISGFNNDLSSSVIQKIMEIKN